MPCTCDRKEDHRAKIPVTTLGIPACVARPVSKEEVAAKPIAQDAMHKEWTRLRGKDVWDASTVCEWGKANTVVHMGRLFWDNGGKS